MQCMSLECYEKGHCKIKERAENCSLHRDFMIEVYTERKYFLLPKGRIEEADRYAVEVLGICKSE